MKSEDVRLPLISQRDGAERRAEPLHTHMLAGNAPAPAEPGRVRNAQERASYSPISRWR